VALADGLVRDRDQLYVVRFFGMAAAVLSTVVLYLRTCWFHGNPRTSHGISVVYCPALRLAAMSASNGFPGFFSILSPGWASGRCAGCGRSKHAGPALRMASRSS